MKLEGSLDAFGLPDVFQLLSYTKKAGGLHLRNAGARGVVYFANGAVTGASAEEARQSLARRLIGSGVVGDAALRDAIERAGAGQVGVGRALLESGGVDEELLREAATEQAIDAVFDLLRWAQGDFAFSMDEDNPDDVGVQLTTDWVVEEANRRREAWDQASTVIPSPDAVLTLPVVLPGDPDVTRDEWALLALVDGRRRVRDLVDVTGCGQFAVVSTLAGLVGRGLVAVRDGDDDHVTGVARRMALLAGLEGAGADAGPVRATEPPAAPKPSATAAPEAGDAPEERPEAPVGRSAGPPVTSRPEPTFSPVRRPDPQPASTLSPVGSLVSSSVSSSVGSSVGEVHGSTAVAPDPEARSLIERDPSVNRSLLLRLIAGVRGL